MYLTEYHNLIAPITWGPIRAQFHLLDEPPKNELISNVNIVPRTNDGWVILLLNDGSGVSHWEIPGGTLEPHEHYLDTIHRELQEEVGAEILSTRLLGAFHCKSSLQEPYRPHLPHPESYRLIFAGDVRVVGSPTNPPGGEQVKRVEVVTLETAVLRFRGNERHDLADLYRLAAASLIS